MFPLHAGSGLQDLDITKGEFAAPKQLVKLFLSFYALNTRSTPSMHLLKLRCFHLLYVKLFLSPTVLPLIRPLFQHLGRRISQINRLHYRQSDKTLYTAAPLL